MVLHIPGILPLKRNVHLSYLIDYCVTEYQFLYKFLEINLGKNSGLLWSLQCCRVCGWYYSSSLYDCSCAFFPMGGKKWFVSTKADSHQNHCLWKCVVVDLEELG